MTAPASGMVLPFVPIARRIERVDDVVDVATVDVDHTNFATYAVTPDGRRWVRKQDPNIGWQEFLGEAIGWLVGKRIGAPVPNGAAHEATMSWLSAFAVPVTHWDRTRRDFIANADQLGAMLTLDAIIANDDRNAGNILMQPDPDESRILVWAIDTERALAGRPAEYDAFAMAATNVSNHARGLPVDLLEAGALVAATAAAGIPDAELQDFAREGCELAREVNWQPLYHGLRRRCDGAETLVRQYLHDLRAIG